jgi:hypothetical protein
VVKIGKTPVLELDIPPGGLIAEIGDQRQHDVERARALVGGDVGLSYGGRKPDLGRRQKSGGSTASCFDPRQPLVILIDQWRGF